MFEVREIKDEKEYHPLLISKDAPFTQAWFFGQWQEITGRKVRRFEIKKNSEIIGFFQTIKYLLPFGQSFLYVPHGPVTKETNSDNEFLKAFHDELIKISKEENAIFVRFDIYSHYPNYGSKENLKKYFYRIPDYVYHSSYFQPKYEWILNLEKSEKELLADMHSKTRYNIGLAEKRSVKIEIISDNFEKYFYDFYGLIEETAKRDNFGLHPKIYYQNIFKTLNSNNAFLAIAGYENKILSVNLILLYGETAYFLYGGSSDELKNLMAPHLAHWQAIKEAKNREFKFYNFGAVNNENFSAKNKPASNWEGISRFKKGFGGELFEYSDSYDLVLKPVWYNLYRFAKSIRQTR